MKLPKRLIGETLGEYKKKVGPAFDQAMTDLKLKQNNEKYDMSGVDIDAVHKRGRE